MFKYYGRFSLGTQQERSASHSFADDAAGILLCNACARMTGPAMRVFTICNSDNITIFDVVVHASKERYPETTLLELARLGDGRLQ